MSGEDEGAAASGLPEGTRKRKRVPNGGDDDEDDDGCEDDDNDEDDIDVSAED